MSESERQTRHYALKRGRSRVLPIEFSDDDIAALLTAENVTVEDSSGAGQASRARRLLGHALSPLIRKIVRRSLEKFYHT